MDESIINPRRRAPDLDLPRLKALWAKVDRVLEADKRFFERNLWRSYRVRRAAGAEREPAALATGPVRPLRVGLVWCVVVRSIPPIGRVRAFLAYYEEAGTDATDE